MKKRYFILLSSLLFVTACNNSKQELTNTSPNSSLSSVEESTTNVTEDESSSNTESTSNELNSSTSSINTTASENSTSSSIQNNDDSLAFVKTNMNYQDSGMNIINPECGFYNPEYLYLKQSNNQALTIKKELASQYSLIHLRVGLEAFSSKASGSDTLISDNALNALKQTLTNIKNLNMSCIIRFSYNMQGKKNGNNYLEAEPSISLIEEHIKQICNVLNEYKDTILTIESGMLGPWGEQHSTSLAQDENAIVRVMDTFLNNLDSSLTINVRYPLAFIRYAKSHGLTSASLENIHNIDFSSVPNFSRIGMFNDGYMANHEDYGTYTNRENEVSFLYKQAQNTIFGGEVESATSEIINAYNTSKNVIQEAYRTHTTYLNDIYRKEVIDAWKKEKYDGNDQAFANKTGYDYIKNHFGYRYIFKNIEVTKELENANHGKLRFIIENRGFASLVKDKKVELIIKNDKNTYKTNLNLDLTEIKSLSQAKYDVEFNLPENMLNEKYNLYLKITEDGNNYLPIKFANKDVFDTSINANYLGEINIKNCHGTGFNANVTNKLSSKAFYDTEGGKVSSSSEIEVGKVSAIGSLINLNATTDIANVTMHKGSYNADNYLDIEIKNYNSKFTQMELSYYTSNNITFSAYEGTNWNDCLFYKHSDGSGTNTYNLDISNTDIYKNVIKNKTSFTLRLFLGHGQTLTSEMNFTLKTLSFYNPNGNETVSVTYKGDDSYLGSEFYLYADKNSMMTIKKNYFVSDKQFKYYLDQNNKRYNELDNVKLTSDLILRPVFE